VHTRSLAKRQGVSDTLEAAKAFFETWQTAATGFVADDADSRSCESSRDKERNRAGVYRRVRCRPFA
jgi:hypothetical protein